MTLAASQLPTLSPQQSVTAMNSGMTSTSATTFAPLQPLRQHLEQISIQDAQLAHRLCKFIPAQCPFARDISVFGRTLLRIPPLCKLNPFYEEVVSLRFRALCYLADVCGEDITPYC